MYLTYADEVKKFLICLTNNYDLSEDLTQETFYQAYKSIKRYNGKCKLSVWLCQIAKHLFYDYLKRQKNYKMVDLETQLLLEHPSSDKGIEEQIILKEEVDEILAEISKMKEPYNRVFLLRLLGEMSFMEIGEIFEKSENWARVTFYRAKSKMKERVINSGVDM